MAMNIKKGDTIVVLSGKDKGKQGKVLSTMPTVGTRIGSLVQRFVDRNFGRR